MKTNDGYLRLKDIYNKALHERLVSDDIADLSVYSRCQIIHDLVGALRAKVPQAKHGTARHTRESLLLIAQSFEPSGALLSEQYKKRKRFLNEIQQDHNSDILLCFQNWQDVAPADKKNAIERVSGLHQKIYMSGIADVIPVEHYFKDNMMAGVDKKLLGGFAGEISKSRGKMSHNFGLYSDLACALETTHHETTHAIQFGLACAYHYQKIRPDHALFEDAKIFHAIEVNKAMISLGVLKSTEIDAYTQQMHEILAEDEGRLIGAGIMEMVRD